MSLHAPATLVLQQFPAVPADIPVALGNRGGFSGARLWKVASLCLRVWPEQVSPVRLSFIHKEMIRAAAQGLEFVPKVHATRPGSTWVEHDGRVWDLTTWMPGVADFENNPTNARLEQACIALARLHNAWLQQAVGFKCPAVLRRLTRCHEWQLLVQSGWRPGPAVGLSDPVDDLVQRAWRVLPGFLERLPDRLRPWVTRLVPIQTCLLDVWHDHILFTGGTVSGVIDYGSVRYDHVAVDLARLLGSLVGDDGARVAAGLAAYRRVRSLTSEEEELVRLLDESGTLLGVANWLIWLRREHRQFEDLPAVARRLGTLVARVERWQ
jgi:Ser/Thr protein kinase RdoA (MazF antagonist)